MILRVAVAAAGLAGCAYRPSSFEYGVGPERAFAGERVTIGCLDIGIARRADFEGSAVLHYRFGNRCDRPVEIDLGNVAVVGRLVDGRELELRPYDPELQIQPKQLGGRLAGGEALAYRTPEPAAQVCVDAASLSRGQPARWLCFAALGEPHAPDPSADDPSADDRGAADPIAAASGAAPISDGPMAADPIAADPVAADRGAAGPIAEVKP